MSGEKVHSWCQIIIPFYIKLINIKSYDTNGAVWYYVVSSRGIPATDRGLLSVCINTRGQSHMRMRWVNLATSILQAQVEVEVVQEETPPRTCEIDHSVSVRMHCSSNNNYNDNDEDYSKNHQQQTGLRTNSLHQLLLRLAISQLLECKISSSVKQRKRSIQWYEQVINLLLSPKGNKYYQIIVFVFLTMHPNLLTISASVKILNCNLILDNDLEIDTAENKINLWKPRNRNNNKKTIKHYQGWIWFLEFGCFQKLGSSLCSCRMRVVNVRTNIIWKVNKFSIMQSKAHKS